MADLVQVQVVVVDIQRQARARLAASHKAPEFGFGYSALRGPGSAATGISAAFGQEIRAASLCFGASISRRIDTSTQPGSLIDSVSSGASCKVPAPISFLATVKGDVSSPARLRAPSDGYGTSQESKGQTGCKATQLFYPYQSNGQTTPMTGS